MSKKTTFSREIVEVLFPLDLEELAGELLGEDFDLFNLDFGLAFLTSTRPIAASVFDRSRLLLWAQEQCS